MCEFISWIKKGNKNYFLTYDMIFNTPRGEILRKQFKTEKPEDFYGHECIRKYFELTGGIGQEKEETDFSTPMNFPAVIVKAIKEGKLRGLALPKGLLTQPADAEYQKVTQPAYAEYQKVTQPADAEYQKVRQAAYAEYQKVTQPADAEYQKVRQAAYAEYQKVTQPAYAEYQKVTQPAYAEYQKVTQPAYAEYQKVTQPAYAEYQKVMQPADAEYQKVTQDAFWDLFAKPENRNPGWR